MRISKFPTYLVKGLNSRYYFRIVVPVDVRQSLGGQREYRRALGTTDMRKALPLAWGLAAKYKILFKRCRIMGRDPNDPLKDAVMSTELLVERKISPDGTITENITFDDPDVKKDKERLKAYENQMTKKNTQGPRADVRAGISRSASPVMLSELVTKYSAERIAKGYWSENTKAENNSAYAKLVKLIGDRPIDSISRDDANRLLTILKQMPSKRGGTLSENVINKKTGMMSSLYIYAIDNQLTTYNPFKNMQLKVDDLPEDAQDVYTPQEFKALFNPKYFKIDRERPSRFWIPLLMALGGCRPGELSQLTVEDIFDIENVPCLHINDLMQRKSKNAVRTIPISDELKRLGFLSFVEQRRQELISNKKLTDRRLFRELNPDRPKKAGAVSSWWNETHHKRCQVARTSPVTLGRVTKERHVSLYSLRHLVQTSFRTEGIKETISAEIVGHAKGETTGYKTYAKRGQLKPLIEAIKVLDYGDALANVPIWP